MKKNKIKIIRHGGNTCYTLNGKFHRLDGPAVEYADGTKEWYKKGLYHREDGPAVEYANGDKYWYKNGKYHRLDGPAVEYANGNKYWYLNGKHHRTDGPAFEWSDGYKAWWINGKKYSEYNFNVKMNLPIRVVKHTMEEIIDILGYPIIIVKSH